MTTDARVVEDDTDVSVSELQAEIDDLRDEVRRKDRIVAELQDELKGLRDRLTYHSQWYEAIHGLLQIAERELGIDRP